MRNVVMGAFLRTAPRASYPHSGFGQVGPHGDLLPGAHVRVAIPLEGGL